MRTLYVKFEQIGTDVLGMHPTGIRSNLVRVTLNRAKKQHWEWVCTGRELDAEEHAFYRKNYPLVMRSGIDFPEKGQPC